MDRRTRSQRLLCLFAHILSILSSQATSEELKKQALFSSKSHSNMDHFKKHAYATIMYCGTPKDKEYHVATRVLLQGISRYRPNADLIVLVSSSCPKVFLNEYMMDGFRVVAIEDIPNPYQSQAKFDKRFIASLNKIYAWSLSEYDRVVMLDGDNIFLRNSDELFQCGEFCAVFIDPCLFHTGLFVLKPSNVTFHTMLKKVGHIKSLDGGDQGFLLSYFPDLLSQPLFRPPTDGSALSGQYRLPFGYQMDASYYYWRMKWRVPCSPNSVITFPGVPMLKPWYWYSWPVLPLGLMWHEQRRTTIGYQSEVLTAGIQALVYFMATILSNVISRSISSKRSSPLCCDRNLDNFPCSPLLSWALKSVFSSLIVLSYILPFWLVPSTIHPLMGWTLYFFGALCTAYCLGCTLSIQWKLSLYVPWMLLLLNWINLALPVYSHGFPRMMSMSALAMVSFPVLTWSFKEVLSFLALPREREPLMGLCAAGKPKKMTTFFVSTLP